MSTPPSGLDRLLALEEIRELPLRYAAAIESRDLDLMARLFSPNARFGAHGKGDVGVRSLMADSLRTSVFAVILVANHLIDLVDADHAHGEVWARCYAQAEPEGFVEQLIRYVDDYERVDGRWTFVRRRHRLWLGASVEPTPFDQQPADWPASQVGVGDVPLADPVFRAWYEARHPTSSAGGST